jgi:hypothetical protein
MIIARPTASEERWLVLADRYPALHAAIDATRRGNGWKTTTWLGRCLGFVLGIVGSLMLAGVLSQFPAPWLTGGLLLIGVAEWLVAQRRVFRSGVEEAPYLCGVVAVVVQLLVWSDGNNDALGVALIATAVLFAGWRLLNPLFTTLAAAGYSLAVALTGGSLFGGSLQTQAAGLACAVLAIGGLLAGAREWRRPSHDRMLDGMVIAMPWIGYGWLVQYNVNNGVSAHYLALPFALAFLVVNLLMGAKRRQHAPLIGAVGNLVCAAYSLHRLLAWPMHWRLIAGGAALLAVAIVLERVLRHRDAGVTSRALNEPVGLDVVQIAGAASLAPATGSPPPAAVHGQGGEFGGGGASGRY